MSRSLRMRTGGSNCRRKRNRKATPGKARQQKGESKEPQVPWQVWAAPSGTPGGEAAVIARGHLFEVPPCYDLRSLWSTAPPSSALKDPEHPFGVCVPCGAWSLRRSRKIPAYRSTATARCRRLRRSRERRFCVTFDSLASVRFCLRGPGFAAWGF